MPSSSRKCTLSGLPLWLRSFVVAPRRNGLRQKVERAVLASLLITCVVNFVNRLLDIKPGVLSCIIGTIYVDMEFKPNVLQELACDVFKLVIGYGLYSGSL